MRIFKVINISGDYATLVDEGGEELFIAMALLPENVDIGSRLACENMEFTFIE